VFGRDQNRVRSIQLRALLIRPQSSPALGCFTASARIRNPFCVDDLRGTAPSFHSVCAVRRGVVETARRACRRGRGVGLGDTHDIDASLVWLRLFPTPFCFPSSPNALCATFLHGRGRYVCCLHSGQICKCQRGHRIKRTTHTTHDDVARTGDSRSGGHGGGYITRR
jgi:hypothetical protein